MALLGLGLLGAGMVVAPSGRGVRQNRLPSLPTPGRGHRHDPGLFRF